MWRELLGAVVCCLSLISCGIVDSNPIYTYDDIKGVWYCDQRPGFVQTCLFRDDSIIVYDDFYYTNTQVSNKGSEMCVYNVFDITGDTTLIDTIHAPKSVGTQVRYVDITDSAGKLQEVQKWLVEFSHSLSGITLCSLHVYLQGRASASFNTYTSWDDRNQEIVEFCLSETVDERPVESTCMLNVWAIEQIIRHSDPAIPDTMIWRSVDNGGNLRYGKEILVSKKPVNLRYSSDYMVNPSEPER